VSRSGHRLRRLTTKRRAAVTALRKHAQATVAEFGFIDGEPVDHAHEGLLTAFYANPSDGAASRYCWAILRETEPGAITLTQLIAVMAAEYEAFALAQANGCAHTEGVRDDLRQLLAERSGQCRADRLAFTAAVLQRLLLVIRYIHGHSTAIARELEVEVAEVSAAADDAHRKLRKARLHRLNAARSRT
jgi:hypothetical protein